MRARVILANKQTILYGLLLALLLFLLKWLELRLVIINHAFQIYVGTIALLFTALGIWVALKLVNRKSEPVIIEKTVYVKAADFTLDEKALHQYAISKRELDVLQLMAQGMSNDEIANRLHVSLSTVKTHSRNLFEKLGVVRRTQAIDKAKKIGIIP